MKIKAVEICGFKSFPEKVGLSFQSPVTCVVGPNGCGKSNIVDAIKWVIGEMSMKELRSNMMEDIIFTGSEVRPPLNMAEVSITLSNDDRRAPEPFTDSAEICVKRRFFRDGEGEFFINNTPCRLKDISDIFMDSGVGTETYSIIEQGRVDHIVSSRPEEKRLIIEEAAGITKYKSRKIQAQRKMDSTRQNLLRVNDILAELKRQILSVQRQASKAQKYRELKGELDSLVLLLEAKSYRDIVEEIKRSEGENKPLEDEISEKSARIANLGASLESAKLALVDEEKDIEASNQEIFLQSSEIQKIQSSLELLKSEVEGLKTTSASKDGEISELARRIEEQRALSGERDVSKETLVKSLETLKSAISALEQGILSRREEQQRAWDKEESTKASIYSVISRITEARNTLSNADKAKREALVRIERLERERVELQAIKSNASLEFEAFRNASGETKRIKDELLRAKGSKQEELTSLKAAFEEKTQRFSSNSLKLEEAKTRLKSLVEYESQMREFETGLKELLSDPASGVTHDNLSLVADIFAVRGGYEAACQAALGAKFRGVLASDSKLKLDVLRHIRGKGLLRNVVIDRELKVRKYEVPGSASGSQGYIGRLVDFVSSTAEYEGLKEVLFGGFLVFKDLEDALEFYKVQDSDFELVTLHGELLESSGIIESGRFAGLGGGLFERRSEIGEKNSMVASLMRENESIKGFLKEGAARISALESEIELLTKETHTHDLRLTEQDKDISRIEALINENARRLDTLVVEAAEARRIHDAALLEEEGTRRIMTECEASKTELETMLASDKESSDSMQRSLDEKQSELMRLNTETAQTGERIESVSKEIDAITKSIEVSERDIASRRSEIDAAKARIALIQKEGEEKEQGLRSLVLNIDASRSLLEEKRHGNALRKEDIRKSEEVLKQDNEAFLKLHSKLSDLNLKLSEMRVKASMLLERVKGDFSVDLASDSDVLKGKESATTPESLETARTRVLELKEKVDSLGEVNVGAIEELKEVEERHRFLTEQKEDLETSLVNLDKMIKRINLTSKKRFEETFEIVNEKFKEVFPRLFEGGKAHLVLLDQENVLESGVDIVAQPTGKKLQNMNLLSGGEKALTAIALIIAIFLHKPAPFCILDEVDAPLDDANVLRFNKIIRELSDRSQFIIITHNKVTMEVAETLYGITMEEHGVSKIVSVRFTDEEERRNLEATIAA